jgi:Flp pilus assembly protein TadB
MKRKFVSILSATVFLAQPVGASDMSAPVVIQSEVEKAKPVVSANISNLFEIQKIRFEQDVKRISQESEKLELRRKELAYKEEGLGKHLRRAKFALCLFGCVTAVVAVFLGVVLSLKLTEPEK